MMLDDSEQLLRTVVATISALASYIIVAMAFFGWLVRQKKDSN